MGDTGGFNAAAETQANLIRATEERIREYMSQGKCCDAYFALGQAIHYLTDSWTESHAVRDNNGRISMFQDYNRQNLNMHKMMDNLAGYNESLYNSAVSASGQLIQDAMTVSPGNPDASGYYEMTGGASVNILMEMERRSLLDIILNGI